MNKASKDASKARGLSREELAIQRERDEFNREQIEQMNKWTREDRKDLLSRRDRARGLYDPVEESTVALAMEGPQYEEAMARSDADVAQAYGMARDQEARRRSRYGINVASGAAMAEARRTGNEEALAKVGGREMARRAEDDKDWARKMAVLGSGNIRNVTPNTNLQQLGVQGQAGSLAAQSQMYGQSAAAGYGLAGSLAADAIKYGMQTPTQSFSRPTSSASTLNTWRTR